jgi:hypothetical protein
MLRETISDSLITQFSLRNIEEPAFVRNYLKPFKNWNSMTLSSGGQKIKTLPNAGGNSVNSEVFSFEVLQFLVNANLQATEMELEYFPLGSKITDYSIRINDTVFGVSVTRAMKFGNEMFNESDAERLLSKKLFGVNASTKAVLRRFRWRKQLLHIWAESKHVADTLERVYHSSAISDSLKNNTLVIVTVCPDTPFIFYDK